MLLLAAAEVMNGTTQLCIILSSLPSTVLSKRTLVSSIVDLTDSVCSCFL